MTSYDVPKPVYEIPSQVGPWSLQEVIYSNHSNVRIVTTNSPMWVVKITFGAPPSTEELTNLLILGQNSVSCAVSVPTNVYNRFGVGPNYVWYAMRRYDGYITINIFSRVQWRSIGISLLWFLRDLHIKCGRVHMDIKTTNILYKDQPELPPVFVVADYELVDTIDLTKSTRLYSNNTKWYYVAMGAMLDEPLYSWRMDLSAVGYTLASLTHDYDNKKSWKYYEHCMARRENRLSLDISDDSIIALREQEIKEEHPAILAYLKAISEISWSSATPPSDDTYRHLISIIESF